MTALMHACIKGSRNIIKFLVKKGAKVDFRDSKGGTALTHACNTGSLGMVKYLFEENTSRISRSHKEIIFEGINALNIYGITVLLYICVVKSSFEVIGYLIEKGGDVNAFDDNDVSMLMYACMGGSSFGIIKYLIEKGADVNAADCKRKTVLMYACWAESSFEIIEHLIEKGAEISAIDWYDSNVVDWCKSDEIRDYIKKLLYSPSELFIDFEDGHVKDCIQSINDLYDVNQRYDRMNILAHLLLTISLGKSTMFGLNR